MKRMIKAVKNSMYLKDLKMLKRILNNILSMRNLITHLINLSFS